jgi:hypothetical protein
MTRSSWVEKNAVAALTLIAVATTGCSAAQDSPELQVPAVASPSPADAAYEGAGLTRACHLAATGLSYGRNVKRVDDGAGRVYQLKPSEEVESEQKAATSLFFDSEASGHPVSWLSEIACAPNADRIAVAYDVSGSAGEPESEPWLVVLDGEARIVTEWTLSKEAGPVQISFAAIRGTPSRPTSTQVDVLEFADEDAVARWFGERG